MKPSGSCIMVSTFDLENIKSRKKFSKQNPVFMDKKNKNNFEFSPKFLIALFSCLLVRLMPLRAPNIEPVFAAMMPMSRAYGMFSGFFFGAMSILLYDITTGTLGVRTLFTGGAYGLMGLWAGAYFKGKNIGSRDYVKFAIWGTLLYDAMTGLTVGPIFFHQSFLAALYGQMPFTALHLLGNIIFAYCLSPGIYNFLIRKKIKEKEIVINSPLSPKII